MNNLISIFMNYKINRLIEYGVLIYQENTELIRNIFREYFRTYVDNYYYDIFNTIDDNSKLTKENQNLEFVGVMQEMLDDYRAYELRVSNDEYNRGRKTIQDLKDISLEIIKIDTLKYNDKDELISVVSDFISNNSVLNKLIDNRVNKLIGLIKDTYNTNKKLLSYEDSYFDLNMRGFENNKNIYFVKLANQVKVLNTYRKGMVSRVYNDGRLEKKKLECLIQKASLYILKKVINKETVDNLIIEIDDSIVNRGKIDEEIANLIDNPLFLKYAVIGVNYNTYLNQQDAFSGDYTLACLQDFTHINDVYQKSDNIYKEGIFSYLIVLDCKYRDREFFVNYDNSNSMKVLIFEED